MLLWQTSRVLSCRRTGSSPRFWQRPSAAYIEGSRSHWLIRALQTKARRAVAPMNTTDLVRAVDNRLERLFDAVIDPARREGAMALLLCGYAAAWWLYAVISNSSQDIYVDMGEMFAWSRPVTLGTPKHPPLGAWLVRAWFSVMPIRPWAYYLFAVISATVALWIAWRISARYLSAEKRGRPRAADLRSVLQLSRAEVQR